MEEFFEDKSGRSACEQRFSSLDDLEEGNTTSAHGNDRGKVDHGVVETQRKKPLEIDSGEFGGSAKAGDPEWKEPDATNN